MNIDAASHAALPFAVPPNLWSDTDAAGLGSEQLLLYRSNLLGADLSVTNFGGGNTSAKIPSVDPISGEAVQVLWVKGSGGDLGSMRLDGFATLYLNKLLQLDRLYRGAAFEDDMVSLLPHCAFGLNPRAASIDTPLHGYLPQAHIDHVHPDAIIALCASSTGERAAEEIWGGDVGWLPWKRPGFDLGLRLRDYVSRRPKMRGVLLAGHGLICWGDTSRACYENTIELISDAARYLNTRLATKPAFGGAAILPAAPSERRAIAARLMTKLRGLMAGARGKIAHFCDDAETLEFVCSREAARLAAIGTSCPDHFLRTKISPLLLDLDRFEDGAYLAAALEAYRAAYWDYYERHARPGDPAMRDSNPVIILAPGIGRFAFAADKTTARLASEFYGNAINVMRGAESIGAYQGLAEDEAFAIEYWALEEAKLQRMPKPKPLAGKIALVTGAGGAIGAASARRLASEGACVMLADFDPAALQDIQAELSAMHGEDVIRASLCDVTREADIQSTLDACALEFGGLDILVANAGLASSAAIEETSLDLWRRNYGVLVEGYFLSARAAFPLMRAAGGGSIIFIGSKNALAATPNASAYASAKAAAVHLARCLALEGAPARIRVNVVNPDAVIRGSKIWNGAWREERAAAYGVHPGDALEEYYRERSMLKQNVFPEDVAEAVFFFASGAAAKSTGNIINVDAGNSHAFTR